MSTSLKNKNSEKNCISDNKQVNNLQLHMFSILIKKLKNININIKKYI